MDGLKLETAKKWKRNKIPQSKLLHHSRTTQWRVHAFVYQIMAKVAINTCKNI